MKLVNVLSALLLTTSVTANAQQHPGVEKSWEDGIAYIPGQFFNKSPPKVVLDKKYPVVILAHGCTGITQSERSWANTISGLGFVVIVPNSFARPSRVSNCNAVNQKSTGAFWYAEEYRQEEITFSLNKLQSLPWVDKNNIFLMGHSEGGRASATSNHFEFKGKIISGWTCTHIFGTWHGINGPKTMPMLAVAYLNDPWRGGQMNQARCSDQAEGITSFTQVDLAGYGHDTSSDYTAKKAVTEFLKNNLN